MTKNSTLINKILNFSNTLTLNFLLDFLRSSIES